MYTYKPNQDELAVAWFLAKRRRKMNFGNKNIVTSFRGMELSSDELFIQDFKAACSEIAVSRVLNLCWTGLGRTQNSGKVNTDIGNFIEVRSICKANYGLIARKSDNDSSPAVLVFVDDDYCCSLLGWETFENVKLFGRKMGDENQPFWVLKDLNEIDELEFSGRTLVS